MKSDASRLRLIGLWQQEFRGYNFSAFQRDLLAGVTVAAVALPLALAFGVASGATAAAGLVTAIVAGIVISVLGGAPFQISGPTGAMSAVLILVASRHGIEGVWTVSLMAGVLIFLMGIFKLGRIINFIPSAVITGFTSGIAVIIFIGQIGNLLGVETVTASNAFVQLWHYLRFDETPNGAAIGISMLVIGTMVLWPSKLNARFPGSLLALIAASVAAGLLGLDVPIIGEIPQTIVLEERLLPKAIPWGQMGVLAGPALSVAILGAIESLLCGAVIGRQTGTKLDSTQELYAQGIGNIIVPFFGGVPVTAAIARASVAVRSGAATRVTGVVHGVMLLLAALLLAPVIARVPVSALAGVLAVTAWRMNDWEAIRDIVRTRFHSEWPVFFATLIATAVFDLTQAIILGLGLSALIFVFQSSGAEVIHRPVSVDAMREIGHEFRSDPERMLVVYIVGPLFFGTVHTFTSVLDGLDKADDVILSLRTVPLIDTSGVRAIKELIRRMESENRRLYLSGLAKPVRDKLERSGVVDKLGEERIFWSADLAIIAADKSRFVESGGGGD